MNLHYVISSMQFTVFNIIYMSVQFVMLHKHNLARVTAITIMLHYANATLLYKCSLHYIMLPITILIMFCNSNIISIVATSFSLHYAM